MSWEPKVVPNRSLTERELDEELAAIHKRVNEAIIATLRVESSLLQGRDDAEHWLAEIRVALVDVPCKVENAANCAGNLIHGEEVSA